MWSSYAQWSGALLTIDTNAVVVVVAVLLDLLGYRVAEPIQEAGASTINSYKYSKLLYVAPNTDGRMY